MEDEQYDDRIARERLAIFVSDMAEVKIMPLVAIGMTTDGKRNLAVATRKETSKEEVVWMLKHLLRDLESGLFDELR